MKHNVAARKSVLHIIHGFGAGGAETWLLSVVKYLHQHPELNLQIDFLATGGERGLFDDEIVSYGSNIYYVRYSLKNPLPFRRELRSILSRNKYAAVHDHQDFISGWHFLFGGAALPSIRIAHLHNPYGFVHNYVVTAFRRFSFYTGRRLMAKKATAITGTSNAVMDEYGYNRPPYVGKRVAPAYCGFDTSDFRYDQSARHTICSEFGWSTSVKIALFVGRIGMHSSDTQLSHKNPEFALHIAKELVTKYENWRFLFVGFKGRAGEQMENEISKTNFADKIRFAGVRKDMPQIMSAADVFVFPSTSEGLGMVAVEAQCTGLKVVMSDAVPEEAIVCSELVERKTLSAGHVPWVEAIVRISESANERCQYSERIRKSPFSIDNSVNRLISLYEN